MEFITDGAILTGSGVGSPTDIHSTDCAETVKGFAGVSLGGVGLA